MSAREITLSTIRASRGKTVPAPPPYRAPSVVDPINVFAERARLAHAEVRVIDSDAQVPLAVAELLRDRNLPATVHVPPAASGLPWDFAPGLTIEKAAPGADDTAVAIASFGIAETGTLAYPSHADGPASWHFRAGFEIAVLHAEKILSHMEQVIDHLKSLRLPSTVNFVTGPSRTGDIEQTLELGAHGPKALAILVVKG